MPLQGLIWAEAAPRITRSAAPDFAASPVGQIIGSINEVRRSADVVLDLAEGCIDTLEQLCRLIGH
jgi:hypothetical protein